MSNPLSFHVSVSVADLSAESLMRSAEALVAVAAQLATEGNTMPQDVTGRATYEGVKVAVTLVSAAFAAEIMKSLDTAKDDAGSIGRPLDPSEIN